MINGSYCLHNLAATYEHNSHIHTDGEINGIQVRDIFNEDK